MTKLNAPKKVSKRRRERPRRRGSHVASAICAATQQALLLKSTSTGSLASMASLRSLQSTFSCNSIASIKSFERSLHSIGGMTQSMSGDQDRPILVADSYSDFALRDSQGDTTLTDQFNASKEGLSLHASDSVAISKGSETTTAVTETYDDPLVVLEEMHKLRMRVLKTLIALENAARNRKEKIAAKGTNLAMLKTALDSASSEQKKLDSGTDAPKSTATDAIKDLTSTVIQPGLQLAPPLLVGEIGPLKVYPACFGVSTNKKANKDVVSSNRVKEDVKNSPLITLSPTSSMRTPLNTSVNIYDIHPKMASMKQDLPCIRAPVFLRNTPGNITWQDTDRDSDHIVSYTSLPELPLATLLSSESLVPVGYPCSGARNLSPGTYQRRETVSAESNLRVFDIPEPNIVQEDVKSWRNKEKSKKVIRHRDRTPRALAMELGQPPTTNAHNSTLVSPPTINSPTKQDDPSHENGSDVHILGKDRSSIMRKLFPYILHPHDVHNSLYIPARTELSPDQPITPSLETFDHAGELESDFPREWVDDNRLEAQVPYASTEGDSLSAFDPIGAVSILLGIVAYPVKLVWRMTSGL